MSNHQISVNEVLGFIENKTIDIALDVGPGYHKALLYTVGGGLYEVFVHGQVVYSGENVGEAVAAFNGIGPR